MRAVLIITAMLLCGALSGLILAKYWPDAPLPFVLCLGIILAMTATRLIR